MESRFLLPMTLSKQQEKSIYLFGRDYKVRDLYLPQFLQVMNGINILITARDLRVRVGTTVSITMLENDYRLLARPDLHSSVCSSDVLVSSSEWMCW